jgi:hypothetical protein
MDPSAAGVPVSSSSLVPVRISFFLQRVLGLEPLADLELEVDYLSRGQMLHRALAALHRRLNAGSSTPVSPGRQEEAKLAVEIEEVLSALADDMQSDRPVDGAWREIDRRLLVEWLTAYRQQHRSYDDRWKECDRPLLPAYFEVAFGPSRHGDDAADDTGSALGEHRSTAEPFELLCGSETVRLSGRIDRIDVGVVAGQTVFNIVDYKSGSSVRLGSRAIADGLALQLPLYALAAEKLLVDLQAVPWRAAYWYIRDKGYQEAISFYGRGQSVLEISPQWEELREKLLVRVSSLVRAIRGGQFPMHSADKDCTSHCHYHTVCRVNQARAIGKSWLPPRVDA